MTTAYDPHADWRREDRESRHKYVVTFAIDDHTDGLRKMSLTDAQDLVQYAARWTYRTGRIVSVAR